MSGDRRPEEGLTTAALLIALLVIVALVVLGWLACRGVGGC